MPAGLSSSAPLPAGGLDITVKSSMHRHRGGTNAWVHWLAPTWGMVRGHKEGWLTDAVYIEKYLALINEASERLGTSLFPAAELVEFSREHGGGQVTFYCYCPPAVFCHTHILIEFCVGRWPDVFEDGRLIKPDLR